MRNTLTAFALAVFAVACVPTCGVESLPVAQTADAGPDAGGGDGTDAGTQPVPDAGTDAGTVPGPTACAVAGTACGAASECCSNRCPAASSACGALCAADGQPCARATDCCSLACNGTCGSGGLCKQDGQDCLTGTNTECCSNSCVGNRCVAVQTNCHPAGERCSGGGINVCCGGATCINPGQATAHCALPTEAQDPVNGVCFGTGVPCSAAQDCCSNNCAGGTCQL